MNDECVSEASFSRGRPSFKKIKTELNENGKRKRTNNYENMPLSKIVRSDERFDKTLQKVWENLERKLHEKRCGKHELESFGKKWIDATLLHAKDVVKQI